MSETVTLEDMQRELEAHKIALTMMAEEAWAAKTQLEILKNYASRESNLLAAKEYARGVKAREQNQRNES